MDSNKIRELAKFSKWVSVSKRGRNHAVLFVDGVGLAVQNGYAKKLYGIPEKLHLYRQYDGVRSISESDYKAAISYFDTACRENPRWFSKFAETMEGVARRIFEKTDEYRKRNWKEDSSDALYAALLEMTDLQAQLWADIAIYSYYFYFNDILVERTVASLRKRFPAQWDDLQAYITTPSRPTIIGAERRALLVLAQRKLRGSLDESDIDAHRKQYAYLNKYIFWEEGYTRAEIIERINSAADTGEAAIESELRRIDHKPELPAGVIFSEEDKAIVDAMKEAPYSTNLGDEASNYYAFHLRGLFDEIAHRLGISYLQFVSMTLQEIEQSLKSGASVVAPDVLSERLERHCAFFVDGEITVMTGNDYELYKSLQPKEVISEVTECKGNVATRGGIVRAKARIISQTDQLATFNSGEILVTPMTNPTYVPAMQKAAAIVTDDGGLLCHAAIVSRELGIPCIVGTKIATQIFKDGDMVEVDANAGIVRKL